MNVRVYYGHFFLHLHSHPHVAMIYFALIEIHDKYYACLRQSCCSPFPLHLNIQVFVSSSLRLRHSESGSGSRNRPGSSISVVQKFLSPSATPMARSSEIDDIFAATSKGKGKAMLVAAASSSAPVQPLVEKKKKRKRAAEVDAPAPPTPSSRSSDATSAPVKQKKKKVKAVETVFDPSSSEPFAPAKKKTPETVLDPSVPRKVPKTVQDPSTSVSLKPKPTSRRAAPAKAGADADARFADSRGTGPRTFSVRRDAHLLTFYAGKKTEEGWAVFKEDELGISAEAGGASRGWPRSQPVDLPHEQGRRCVLLTANAVRITLRPSRASLMAPEQVFDTLMLCFVGTLPCSDVSALSKPCDAIMVVVEVNKWPTWTLRRPQGSSSDCVLGSLGSFCCLSATSLFIQFVQLLCDRVT
jgi:hypothetical protein